MKRLAIALALLAVAAFGLSHAFAAPAPIRAYLPQVSCLSGCGRSNSTPVPATPSPVPATPSPVPSDYAARMITLVNQARAAAGCPAVTANSILMSAAQDWTNHMAANGDYRHSDGGYYETRGYPVGVLVENIDGAAMDADSAFGHWMGSTPHKRNIEFCYHPDNPSYNPAMVYDVGVGYADGYWTLVIGARIP